MRKDGIENSILIWRTSNLLRLALSSTSVGHLSLTRTHYRDNELQAELTHHGETSFTYHKFRRV